MRLGGISVASPIIASAILAWFASPSIAARREHLNDDLQIVTLVERTACRARQ